ncbi:WbuC family cupin fold metalloprotein [Catenovulum sp. SM1970]|uniref:WbuC family cupin fold metalloprotein n=1 Tax=Marinifaba aquimaris TaxID=2741323 RepID=UPI0015749A1D|nr:WbuC family cupin fold metalloprotein [Marinifaba aquimaris]NTS78101.1 WbuC family cupin fold metalloprotein [Marinifaba aquimaris]
MKVFDQTFFDSLVSDAKQLPRKRTNHNLHQNYDDMVQRLFIAMEPSSYVRPHWHSDDTKWECFIVIKGSLLFIIYDEQGTILAKHELSADGVKKGIEIPPHTWHSTVALCSDTVFFEVKQGPYQALDDKGFATWSPEEGAADVAAFLAFVKDADVGQNASEYKSRT